MVLARGLSQATSFICLLHFAALTAAADEKAALLPPITFDHFYTYEELRDAMQGLARAYPDLIHVQSIGKSFEGRDLWLATINNPATGADTDKPAMYIDGNIHGNEVQAAEVGLYTIWYLAQNRDKIPTLDKLIDDCAFYILPMVNPDGRAHWFEKPNTPHSSRSGTMPMDSDNDGLLDEDGFDDLDADGEVLQMRRRTPLGRYKSSPEDPRLMVRCEPGEVGEFDILGLEGIDNDGDGQINEDGPGGYDMNRNWPSDWQPEYIQGGAGDYPLCFPETEAIAAFLLAHQNVAALQAYHNSGGMILRPPGAQYIPEFPAADRAVYDHLGKKGERMLPFYRYMIIWKDLYTVHGGFVTWAYEHEGIFSFTNELWSNDNMFNAKGQGGFSGSQKERLDYDDLLLFGQTFRDWKPFRHPVYGEVELGGFVKESTRVPPPFMLTEMCHRNAAFTIFHAKAMPKLSFADVQVSGKGGDVHELTIEVRNEHVIPTRAQILADKRSGPRDYIEVVSVGEAPVKVLGGGRLADKFLGPMEPVEHQPERIWLDAGIRGESTEVFRWILQGRGKVVIRYWSAKAREIVRELDFGQ